MTPTVSAPGSEEGTNPSKEVMDGAGWQTQTKGVHLFPFLL